jgi:flagellar basal-body rod protein FlgB
MIDRLFSNEMMAIVSKALDAGALQQRVIANNVANVDTPGFKRSEVIFKERLKAALESRRQSGEDLPAVLTHPQHLPFQEIPSLNSVEPSVVLQGNTSLRNDGNNVDIDVEMARLAENNIYYTALSQLTSMHFTELKSVIREGK